MEAAQGVDKTPFVTIRCTVYPEDGSASVDPFQVSVYEEGGGAGGLDMNNILT